jgi:hypothetical protein
MYLLSILTWEDDYERLGRKYWLSCYYQIVFGAMKNIEQKKTTCTLLAQIHGAGLSKVVID